MKIILVLAALIAALSLAWIAMKGVDVLACVFITQT
jgi:hypothetical protein